MAVLDPVKTIKLNFSGQFLFQYLLGIENRNIKPTKFAGEFQLTFLDKYILDLL